MKRSILSSLVIISSIVAMAGTPAITVEDWQIGVVNGSDGTLGVSTTSDNPKFTEPMLSVTQEGKVGIGTQYPQQDLHIVDGNILISRTSTKTRAAGSKNGSILFGSETSDQDGYQYGRWGIEYLDNEKDGYGLNFWKTWEPTSGYFKLCTFLAEQWQYRYRHQVPSLQVGCHWYYLCKRNSCGLEWCWWCRLCV